MCELPLCFLCFAIPSLWEIDRNGLLLWSMFPVSEFQVFWLGVGSESTSEPGLCLGLPVEWQGGPSQGVPQTDPFVRSRSSWR